MKGFARLPTPAVAAVAVALGLLAGPARAEYLVEAGATVNARGDAPGSVAGSDVTLTATYAPSPGDPASPDTTYSWTIAYAHGRLGPSSYEVTTQVAGGESPGAPIPAGGGFSGPVVGFFALGSTIDFQLAETITPAGGVDGVMMVGLGVEVNTATGQVEITMPPPRGLGPVVAAGTIAAVPEPATVALLGLGGSLLVLVPRLRRRLRRES